MQARSGATTSSDDEDGSVSFGGSSSHKSGDLTEVPRILAILASVLDRLVSRNEHYIASNGQLNHLSSRRKSLTVFHGLKAPSISISKYLERIFKYTSCSPSCFVVGYVYIDRLVHRHPDLPITSFNVHRLLVTSVLTASKILDDVHYNNAFYAKVGGISTSEVNRLELEFLFRLDFRLMVTVQEFESYCSYLDRETAMSRIERSGLPAFESPGKGNYQAYNNGEDLKTLLQRLVN